LAGSFESLSDAAFLPASPVGSLGWTQGAIAPSELRLAAASGRFVALEFTAAGGMT
jgi:hypothetical protein